MAGAVKFFGRLSFVVFLLVLLFVFAMFQGGFVSWFLFFGFLPIFLYQLGLLFYPIRKWHLSRELTSHVVRAGETVTVTVKIKRKIPYPLYYCVCEEVFPQSLQKAAVHQNNYHFFNDPETVQKDRKMKKIIFPGIRREMKFSYALDQIPRGEHKLGTIRLRTGDVFGFVTKEHVFFATSQLVAFPNERPIHMTESMSSYEQGSIASYAMNLKNTNVATGVREYMPGDKFSWIDWKQSAKKNTIITKEFEQEKSTDTMVILDACYEETLNELAFEAGIELTLSLLETIRSHTSQVGFLSVGKKTVYFPLSNDPGKKDLIRQHLTKLQQEGKIPFATKFREELMKMGSGMNVLVITTAMDHAFQEAVNQAKQRAKNVVILFIQASEFITEQRLKTIQQLRLNGVVVNVITEKQLTQETIEVSVT